jgi:hypothetical protein
MLIKEKKISISIWKMVSCFSNHQREHFISLTFTWKHLNIFFLIWKVHLLVCLSLLPFQNIKIAIITHFLVSKVLLVFKLVDANDDSGYKDFVSYISTMNTPYSRLMNENIKPKILNVESNIKAKIVLNENSKQKNLNLGSNIKAQILCVFFFIFFHKRKKNPKH